MYICKECGAESLRWSGKCLSCGNWNSLEEKAIDASDSKGTKGVSKTLSKIESKHQIENRYVTTSGEFNNAVGGGIIEGSLTLLTGEPGIGKSTLTLQIGSFLSDKSIIYVSGEETEGQIMSRAKRLGVEGQNVSILTENNLENIIETLKDNPSDLVIIDSVSVISSNDINGVAGSISQVKYIAEKLMNYAKRNKLAMILIGHVTKDGNLAGPKVLEHLVDTVLYFEGDKFDSIRILRCLKNRFGSTNEVGIFKMEEKGLIDVKNPGLEFISKDGHDTVGSSLSITLEGTRAVIIETESLTTYTKFGYPKRSSRGIPSSKLDMIVAILGKYTDVKLDSYDAYSNIARGLKIDEPGIDMALCASLISSKINAPIPRDTIFVGEVSLTGKVKNVFSLEKRIKEAEKLGFKKIYVPETEITGKYKIEVIKIRYISEIIKYLR